MDKYSEVSEEDMPGSSSVEDVAPSVHSYEGEIGDTHASDVVEDVEDERLEAGSREDDSGGRDQGGVRRSGVNLLYREGHMSTDISRSRIPRQAGCRRPVDDREAVGAPEIPDRVMADRGNGTAGHGASHTEPRTAQTTEGARSRTSASSSSSTSSKPASHYELEEEDWPRRLIRFGRS